jgi:uncharacterized protein YbjQ (UPF0145 family)
MPAPIEYHRECADARKLAGLRLINAASRLTCNGVVIAGRPPLAQQ